MKWVLLTTAIASIVLAQPRDRRIAQAALPVVNNLTGIFHAYPAQSPDSSICIIGYRLYAGDLFYTRREGARTEYVASYVVTIELRDTLGVVRLARVFSDSIVRPRQPSRQAEDAVANTAIVTIANGRYTLSVDVAQYQRQRMLWQRTLTVESLAESIAINSLTFVYPTTKERFDCVEPWGSVVPFGTRRTTALVLVPRAWSGRDELKIVCSLDRQYFPFYRGSDTVVTLPAVSDGERRFVLVVPNLADEHVCLQKLPNDQYRLLECDLDLRRAIPGDYRLQLIRAATADTVTIPFRVQWFMPPLPLLSSRYGLDVMQYVLTDDEYRTLQALPDSDRTAALIAWWSAHDPTPATRYNEAMIEYFRRATEARTKFATPREADGALTDRGKVYILFGEPTRVETNLEPGKAGTEAWYYTNAVHKRFRFEITDDGRYRLAAVEQL